MKIDKIAILNDISSNNINLISFLDTFAKFSQNTEDIEEFIYFNENISQSFFKLTDLKKEDLEDILDILKLIKDKSKKVIWNNGKREEYFILFSKSGFSEDLIELAKKESNIILKEMVWDLEDILDILKLIKDKSKKEDLDIYGEEVERGINEVNWLIEEKNLYQNIFQEFDNEKILDKNSIVNELYRNEDASQSQYLIRTFSNKLWKELDEETIINFLNGLDFYYLSNEAYFFILPACIRYGLEKFEDNEQLDYLTFFLSDKERVNYADEKIKTLVVSYLNLLKKLNFSGFFEKEEKECLELWK